MSPLVKVIQPIGILDSTKAPEFRQEVNKILEGEVDIILVDFKDVNFMDSSGLGAIVLALKTIRAENKKLIICSINEQIKMLFELTSMDRIFEIYENRDEFNQAVLSSSLS